MNAAECIDKFKNKKITLMGLGLLGRGVGDAEFLAQSGAEVLVTDKKSEAELAESVEKLKEYSNISFHFGGHKLEDFTKTDLVIKAAGVPLDAPEIAAARKAGVQVAMSTALFAKFALDAGAMVVGVTGTRGKSTVTQMIAYSLTCAGKQVLIGGNVRGVSTLAMLPKLYEGSPRTPVVVLELDSWQLQGFGDLEISPHIAVFTNLMPDHQNYYPDMDAYFKDKANIFKFQHEGDSLFVGQQVLERIKAARPLAALQVPLAIPADWKLNVIGEHNRENASLAAAALRTLGLPDEEIRSGLESFQSVEGRLQFVREVGGIKIYNDNNATTPEATIAALKALGSDVTLITGGSDKGLDLKELVHEIGEHASHLVLLKNSNYKGSLRLGQELRAKNILFEESDNLADAIQKGMSRLRQGSGEPKKGALLFSPGFASFGMFKNEYDRNDQFLRLVSELS
ncbi:MAG TPA: Mur ligase family protein [Candidatus Paceibacterota bacterium]